MKKTLSSFGALTIAFLLSCSHKTVIEFFNNSQETIEICSAAKEVKPDCNTVNSGESVDIRINFGPSFSIKRGSETKTYLLDVNYNTGLPENFKCGGLFTEHNCKVPVQYEDSGLIYWAGKDQSMPVTNFPKQPEGFPIKPTP